MMKSEIDLLDSIDRKQKDIWMKEIFDEHDKMSHRLSEDYGQSMYRRGKKSAYGESLMIFGFGGAILLLLRQLI